MTKTRAAVPIPAHSSLSCSAETLSDCMPDHESLLRQICRALSPGNVCFQAGDKGLLSRMNSSAAVRFKLKERITEPWQKAFVAIQVVLAKGDGTKMTRSFKQDSQRIMSGSRRVVHCLVELLARQDSGLALRNAFELKGAINGEAWHEGEAALRQIRGIGASYAALLTKAGLGTLEKLKSAQPSQIEVATRRNPPFGHQIQSAGRSIPTLELDCCCKDDGDCSLVVLIRARVEGASKKDACHLLAILRADDHQTLLHERIDAGRVNEHRLKVPYDDDPQELTVSLMCASHGMRYGGIDV